MKNINNQSGQSTIEFIFSFSIAFFIIIYTIKIALNYTTGYLVHYATYMSSRAYLTFEGNGNETAASSTAVEVFRGTKVDAYFSGLNIDANNPRVTGSLTDPQRTILNGIQYDWTTTFSVNGMFGGSQMLNMRSESFLGREPDRKSCVIQTCVAARNSSGQCGRAFTLVDNGC